MPAGPQGGGAPMPQGGAPPQGGPPQGGAPDPGAQLQAAVGQYAQSKDPQLAVQIADMLVQMMGAGDPAAGSGAPPDPSMQGGGGTPGGGGGDPAQMNRKGGKMPSFGSKAKGGEKPAFSVPAGGKGKEAAAMPAKKGAAPAGKPMDAFQKIRAKREAEQMKGKK